MHIRTKQKPAAPMHVKSYQIDGRLLTQQIVPAARAVTKGFGLPRRYGYPDRAQARRADAPQELPIDGRLLRTGAARFTSAETLPIGANSIASYVQAVKGVLQAPTSRRAANARSCCVWRLTASKPKSF